MCVSKPASLMLFIRLKGEHEMSENLVNILLSGVGGQGILFASNLICDVMLSKGYDVKKNEIHGMSQRGGSVTSHIRYGEKIYSPVIPEGEADFLVGFELLEGYRYLYMLKDNGLFIYNDYSIVPGSMLLGKKSLYPEDLYERIEKSRVKKKTVRAEDLAKKLGSIQVVNVILMGVLAGQIESNNGSRQIIRDDWYKAIEKRAKPKYTGINKEAFTAGFEISKL